jgi:hypothetical protein
VISLRTALSEWETAGGCERVKADTAQPVALMGGSDGHLAEVDDALG